MAIKTTLKVLGVAVAFAAASQASADGNRYDRDRYYHSEISVAQAYLWMEHSKDFKNVPGQAKPVLVDVRTLREYASGHPGRCIQHSIPEHKGFLRRSDSESSRVLLDGPRSRGGRMDMLPSCCLCRTGSRSIGPATSWPTLNFNPDGAG
jgi:rhodanese-related sulfurtransferase